MSEPCVCAELQDNPQAQFNLLRQIIHDYEKRESNLIQILHLAQAVFGYLSDDVLHFIGEEMDLPLSKIHGVVSFYSYFETQPHGRHTIQVCLGTACYVRGGTKVLDNLKKALGIEVGETTSDGRFTLAVKRCFGSCGLAPAISIDSVIHKRVNPNQLQDILNQYP